MSNHSDTLKRALQTSIAAKQAYLEQAEPFALFERMAERVIAGYRRGGRLYIAGNGGSAADAQHLAAELVVRLARERGPLPAEALTVDSSILTAIANDYGFDQVFARQIAAKMRPDDMFLGITTSGQSPNILRALEACRERGLLSILFAGRDGGPAKALADYCLLAPGADTCCIQEQHIVLAHSLCACIENSLLPATRG